MYSNKVEICGVNTAKLPVLKEQEKTELLRRCARKTFIYHMPLPDTDRSGICRRAETNFRRHGDELRGVTVLESYPQRLRLPPLA